MAVDRILRRTSSLISRSTWLSQYSANLPKRPHVGDRSKSFTSSERKSLGQEPRIFESDIDESDTTDAYHEKSASSITRALPDPNDALQVLPNKSTLEEIGDSVQASADTVADAGKEATAFVGRVLHFDELPKWMKHDPFIRKGYRATENSFGACFWSLFYMHNELVNTWSHLLPAFYFLALFLATDYNVLYPGAKVSRWDEFVIQVYVGGTACCLFLSAMFHSTNSYSEIVAKLCLKLDYLGIVTTISTTCISSTYFGLYGHVELQALYTGVTILCAAAVFYAVLNPHADGPRASAFRANVFTALAASGFLPIVHVSITEGTLGLLRFPLTSLSVTCGSYAIGTAFYVARFPEKYWPEIFDLWGASHQIFHILVAFGQLVHLFGLKKVLLEHRI